MTFLHFLYSRYVHYFDFPFPRLKEKTKNYYMYFLFVFLRYHHTAAINLVYALRESLALLAEEV